MSTSLQEQLKNVEKQKEELEKRIQEEKEQKRVEKQSTIEHLEGLVKPLTEELDLEGDFVLSLGLNTQQIRKSKRKRFQMENNAYDKYLLQAKEVKDGTRFKRQCNIDSVPKSIQKNLDKTVIVPRYYNKNKDLLQEEIYVTLIGILKKQDERIKTLENYILLNHKKK
jgi:hypothetical protein